MTVTAQAILLPPSSHFHLHQEKKNNIIPNQPNNCVSKVVHS